ncbi:amidase family protein [Brevibacterium marinum]|uniref:amidase family protein n=1 Tax=Brevibacterium marinum TaxID=418643 RepID=UPI0014387A08
MDENHETHQAGGSVQSLERTLAAVEGSGRDLNAVTSVMSDRARTLERKTAERASAGQPARSLDGVAFAVKDVIDVAGHPTTMGSKVSSGPDPSTTAPVVSLLERAGALPVAKTNCQEYSYGILGDESAFGRVINPIDPALCTGGSSSGSAALVAAGMVPLALGTDTAGSVRVPAACQGIIGFKPTFGAVPTEGVFPLSPSFDTVGLFARELPLLAEAFKVIVGGRQGPTRAEASLAGTPTASRTPGASLAGTPTVDLSLLKPADESSTEALTWAEHHLGESALAAATSANFDRLTHLIERGIGFYDIVRRYEAYVLHKQFLDDQGEQYQPGVWAKILAGQDIAEADYRSNVASLDELRASAESFFDDVDFLITPAIDGEVTEWDELGPGSAAKFMRYSLPFNVLGWPAVTLPIGAAIEGAMSASEPAMTAASRAKPASVQVVGPPHSDEKLLEFVAGL